MKSFALAVITFCLLVLCISMANSASLPAKSASKAVQTRLVLKQNAMVKPSGMVLVNDIAQIHGNTKQKKEIGEVALLVAPRPGQTKTVDADYIRRKLESVRVNDVKIEGASQITIEGESIRFESAELQEQAKTYLSGVLPPITSGTYSISVINEPDALVLPTGNKVEIQPRLMLSEARVGSNYVLLDARIDGKVAATAKATFKVAVMVEALTATGTIHKGDIISLQNTALRQIEANSTRDFLGSDVFDSKDPIVAKRTIMPGSIIGTNDIANQTAVKKGDMVTLVVLCGNVKLATTAEAQQDACKGDSVMVKADISSGQVRGKVVEPGLVEIRR